MRRTLSILLLLAICAIAGAARCWNAADVFVQGEVYFVDADCYSRMTRAREVAEGRALVIRHHDFENWPEGTRPHTTAPMDWTIAGLSLIADCGLSRSRGTDWSGRRMLRGQAFDLAGAIVSPLLGVLTCAFLGVWAWRQRAPGWAAVPLFFAVSPVVVHCTVLGRPDHQSLEILLVVIALTAELTLAREWSRRWGLIAGVAWALALWVSLYEPLVLLAVVMAGWMVLDRRRFFAREMRAGWIAGGAILLLAWFLEGWRIPWPDASLRRAFAVWQSSIGELAHLDPRAPLLYRWLGLGILAAPIALGAAALAGRPRSTPAILALMLLVAVFGLTVWQLRWGYFLGAIYALSLPWQAETLARWAGAIRMPTRLWPRRAVLALKHPVMGWMVFLAALWPLAVDWDEKLFPEDHPDLGMEMELGVTRLERLRLRELAGQMRGTERQPFLAPWWLSPSIAYWSRQPGVAGSSHESLPGIVASAQFFMAPDAATAERIVRERGVKWVITDDPERLLATSRALAGGEATAATSFVAHLHEIAEPRERVSAEDLRAASPEARAKLLELADRDEAAHLGSAMFSCVWSNQFYKLFSIRGPAN